MANRSEIRDWVRQQTLVEADDFADSKLNNVINQGVREVADADEWPFLEATANLIIEDGSSAYDLPADFATMIAVYDADGDVLPETTRRAAIQDFGSPTADEPQAWYFFGEQIHFVPAPASTIILTLDYIKTPTLLNADQATPEWHAAHHMILAEYAAHKVWEREEDLERSAYHRQLFEIGLGQMRRHYRNRSVDTPIIVGGRVNRRSYPWSWQYEA